MHITNCILIYERVDCRKNLNEYEDGEGDTLLIGFVYTLKWIR